MSRILGIYVGDANGDGKNELVVVREGKLEIYIRNDGFEKVLELDVPIFSIGPSGILIEDVDADGNPEIVLGYVDRGRRVRIEIYSYDELVSSVVSSVPGGSIVGVDAADVDEDKNLEIIAIGANSQGFTTMTVRLPTKPKLMRTGRVPIGKKVTGFAAGDVDADGSIEVLALTDEGLYFRRKGLKRFEKYRVEAYDARDLRLGDVNGDLYIELVLASGSGVYVFSGRELVRSFSTAAEAMTLHDVDNDGVEEILAYHAGKLCVLDVESDSEECLPAKAAKYLAAGKFGDKRLVIAADEEEFRIAAEFEFSVPNVLEEFARVSDEYKPILARYILDVVSGASGEGLVGEMIREARKELDVGNINKAYRILYQLLDDLPNPKKAARIAVLLSYYLLKNPESRIRDTLEKLAGKGDKKKKSTARVVNPREALERLMKGIATEDDLRAAVALFLHDPNRIRGKVPEIFATIKKQFGSAAALDAVLAVFQVAPKSLRAEILLTILANYIRGELFPNEIRAAFKRAAERSRDAETLRMFADVVHKYGQRGMAALIAALSYLEANPDARRLIPRPRFSFKPSRPMRLEEISMSDEVLVPLIVHGAFKVVLKEGCVFRLMPRFLMRFYCDAMLGRLARRLRILGYDTLYSPNVDDEELLSGDRVVITRDKALAERLSKRGKPVILVRSADLVDQLVEVLRAIGVKRIERNPVRCPICNGRLVPVEKSRVRGLVPPKVFEKRNVFRMCLSCGKIYRIGRHRLEILETLELVRRRLTST